MNSVFPSALVTRLPSRWYAVLLFASFSGAWIVATDVAIDLLPARVRHDPVLDTIQDAIYAIIAIIWAYRQLGTRDQIMADAAKELEQTQQRHWQSMQHLPDAVLILVDVTIRYANPAACQLFRTKRSSDLVGRSLLDLIPPDQHAAYQERTRALAAGMAMPELPATIFRLDGSMVEVLAQPMALPHGDGFAMQIVLRDQSQLLQLQKRLHEQEDKYHMLLGLSHVAILGIDVETGTVLEANRNAGVLFARPAEALVGLSARDLMPVDEFQRCRKLFRAGLAGGQIRLGAAKIHLQGAGLQPAFLRATLLKVRARRLSQVVFVEVALHESSLEPDNRPHAVRLSAEAAALPPIRVAPIRIVRPGTGG